MERGRSRGEGAPLPWTQELAGVGLHRKQKVNMSECLFIISLDGVSNPQRCLSAANSCGCCGFLKAQLLGASTPL